MSAWPRGTARLRAAGYSHTIKRIHVNKHIFEGPTIWAEMESDADYRARKGIVMPDTLVSSGLDDNQPND